MHICTSASSWILFKSMAILYKIHCYIMLQGNEWVVIKKAWIQTVHYTFSSLHRKHSMKSQFICLVVAVQYTAKEAIPKNVLTKHLQSTKKFIREMKIYKSFVIRENLLWLLDTMTRLRRVPLCTTGLLSGWLSG